MTIPHLTHDSYPPADLEPWNDPAKVEAAIRDLRRATGAIVWDLAEMKDENGEPLFEKKS